jgi:hypothetical protein
MFRFVASSSEGHPNVAKSGALVDITESCHVRAAPGWQGEYSRHGLGRCSATRYDELAANYLALG